ncbi:MAG: hypothetical protein D4R84_04455 [Rhodocyclaceae bacterium]|nr:MAG: hypothetical protein D4R84_04455 [Rhodocyclaceae bacterium]
MKAHRLIVTSAAALSLLAFANCQAEEGSKQSASSRQASKARDYGNRQEKESPPDAAPASTTTTGQKDDDKLPEVDTRMVDKAAKDTGDNWKKLEKVLDRF